jgi:hypothetical protein
MVSMRRYEQTQVLFLSPILSLALLHEILRIYDILQKPLSSAFLLEAVVAKMTKRIGQQKSRLNPNSPNSSKPPSFRPGFTTWFIKPNGHITELYRQRKELPPHRSRPPGTMTAMSAREMVDFRIRGYMTPAFFNRPSSSGEMLRIPP